MMVLACASGLDVQTRLNVTDRRLAEGEGLGSGSGSLALRRAHGETTIFHNDASENVDLDLDDSRRRASSVGDGCGTWENLDFYGNDLRSIKNVDTWRKCKYHCNDDKNCHSWTWGKPGAWWGVGKTCYLKSKYHKGARKNTNTWSGTPCTVVRFHYDTKGKETFRSTSEKGWHPGCAAVGLWDWEVLNSSTDTDFKYLWLPAGTVAYNWSYGTKFRQLETCRKVTCAKVTDAYVRGKWISLWSWGPSNKRYSDGSPIPRWEDVPSAECESRM